MNSVSLSTESIGSILDIHIPDLEERLAEYRVLSVKAKRIHSSFLFHRENISIDEIPQLCAKVFSSLVKIIGGTKISSTLPGWKDLGFYLGLKSADINYIDNSMRNCPTETVLRVFSQSDDSTLGAIVDALLKMERLDAIEGLYDFMYNLSDILINENDQGYDSSNNLVDNHIIKPKFFANNLPEVLRCQKKSKEFEKIPAPVEMLKKNGPSILLTYFDDGIDAASNISQTIKNQNFIDKEINVICLEDEKMDVLANPEQYIRHYFDEVDYIVPIITEGYLEAIRSPVALHSSSTNNIDCTYARYIYTLMSSHYINGTGCLNRKVRGILPTPINNRVLSELYKFPHLLVWMSENEMKKFIEVNFIKRK